MGEPCPFCDIAAGRAPATILCEWSDALAIEPLHPVTPGHALVIPRVHAIDALDDHVVTASTVSRAATFAQTWIGRTPVPGDWRYGCNLIMSCGAAATQTVFHLHVHVVPRRPDDALALPWTGQETGDVLPAECCAQLPHEVTGHTQEASSDE